MKMEFKGKWYYFSINDDVTYENEKKCFKFASKDPRTEIDDEFVKKFISLAIGSVETIKRLRRNEKDHVCERDSKKTPESFFPRWSSILSNAKFFLNR